jgi:hypothetical protein
MEESSAGVRVDLRRGVSRKSLMKERDGGRDEQRSDMVSDCGSSVGSVELDDLEVVLSGLKH